MARYIDVEGYRKLFDEEYKKTRKLIFEGETHLDNLAEGFSEASRVIDRMPTADVAPRAEVERLKKQLEPFKEVQCFTCKHYDIGHDHVPCCYCEDYNKYIWLSADADTDIHTSNSSEVDNAKSEVAREIFEEIERLITKECLVFKDENGIRGYVDAMEYVKKPLAWALFQVWKKADAGREGK